MSRANADKIVKVMDLAMSMEPIIGLNDSGGAVYRKVLKALPVTPMYSTEM